MNAWRSCRELQHTHGGHHKFWRFLVVEARVTYHWGRIGTAGQQRIKTYTSEPVARWEANRTADEKLSAGYHEVAPPISTPAGLGERSFEKTPLALPAAGSVQAAAQGAAGMHKLAHAMQRAGSNALVVGQKERKRKEAADAEQPSRAITLGEDL